MSSPAQRPSIAPCPACGGPRVGALAYEGALGRRQGKFGTAHISGLTALVCTVCGQVTFYVGNMQSLKEELRKHPESFDY